MDASMATYLVRRAQQDQQEAQSSSNSLSSIISTLVPTILIALALTVAFLFLRRKFGRVYQPRSYDGIVSKDGQTPAPNSSLFGWVSDFKSLSDDHILQHQSLDGYFFLRYLKMLTIVCFVGCCVTWPVLFPVNATGHGGQKQLDMLSMSNVADPNRFYAHALIAWVFLGFTLFAIVRESLYFIGVRQAVFMSTLHAQRLSSRTVLFMGIPEESLNEQSLRQIFGHHVRKIWIVPECKKLEETVEERDKLWGKFEQGQMKLILDTNKQAKKKGASAPNPEDPLSSIDKKSWPTHKLKFLIGKKVNTVDYGRTEIPALTKKIEAMQNEYFDGHGKKAPAAFVEFSSQGAAQEALQFTEKHKLKFSPRYTQIQPEEVIWKNLSMSKGSRKIKMALATTFITLLTIFWAIPVAFVGILSNINYLTNKVPFLSFINDIPSVILGVVTGLLPVVLLAVLMALVPIICRLLAKFAGAPSLVVVELKTQTWYFIFQVIQVFLITTFTSSASSVASQIVQNPGSAVTLLSKNLPKASNFYISYIILQGLMIFAMQLLNVAPLVMIVLLGKFLDKTPRKQYNRWMSLNGIGWGSEYPKYTNLGVIALSYSCIAPLVLGFATLGFGLMYLGYRYNFLFVLGIKVDMRGDSYLKGLRQLLTGIYLSTLCLIGLFAIATANNASSAGPLAIMVVFLVVLIVCHVMITLGLSGLQSNIPVDLLAENQASKMISTDAEQGPRAYSSDDTRADGHNTPAAHNSAAAKTGKEQPTGPREWQPSVSADQRKSNFLTRPFETQIAKARGKAQARLAHDVVEKQPEYHGKELQEAYLHPALATTKDPIVWLARDELGISRALIQGNKEAGISSTDEAAWLDDKGKVNWDVEQPQKAPIWREHRIW